MRGQLLEREADDGVLSLSDSEQVRLESIAHAEFVDKDHQPVPAGVQGATSTVLRPPKRAAERIVARARYLKSCIHRHARAKALFPVDDPQLRYMRIAGSMLRLLQSVHDPDVADSRGLLGV